jgi:hypothetical protein
LSGKQAGFFNAQAVQGTIGHKLSEKKYLPREERAPRLLGHPLANAAVTCRAQNYNGSVYFIGVFLSFFIFIGFFT